MGEAGDLRGRLAGTWYRSFEEEDGPDLVFRPPSYPFPPARAPRPALRLADDGTAATSRPGPDDRPVWSGGAAGATPAGGGADGPGAPAGAWSVEGAVLQVRTGELTGSFTVQDVDPERLVVRPEEDA